MGYGRREFKLYWSSIELYEKCPQRFLWSRGFGNIDVGGGPGRRKPLPEKRSDHHRVMGIVIQDVIERLYNDELWKDPKARTQKGYLLNKLLDMTREKFHYITQKPKFYLPYGAYEPWGKVPTPDEMLEVCLQGVEGYLKTMKANRLLGPYAKAEVDLVGWINDYNPVGGRADLIIRRDDSGVTILDGKNSKSKGKYTNPDQLRWYAMCFYLAFGNMPDRLGFVYYRYPYNGDDEQGVEWVDFTKEDVKGLARRAVDTRNLMNKGNFDPTPSPQNCKFCDYESVCEARLAQKKKKNSRPRKPKEIEVKTQEEVGLFELDFNT